MRGEHRAQVARGVDLGDDRDVQARGEVHDPPDLVLGQVLARDDLGMRVRGDTEALVVREVQAQLVELEVGHLAQPVLDPARGEVLARDVDHQPALRPVRPVPYDAFRHRAPGPTACFSVRVP